MKYSALILILFFNFFVLPSNVKADKATNLRVRQIEILENSGSMFKHTDYLLTCASGAVKNHNNLPKRIKIGDDVSIGENRIMANVIIATYAKETLRYGSEILQDAGTTSCTIAEREDLLPSDRDCNALWILVKKCRVIN